MENLLNSVQLKDNFIREINRKAGFNFPVVFPIAKYHEIIISNVIEEYLKATSKTQLPEILFYSDRPTFQYIFEQWYLNHQELLKISDEKHDSVESINQIQLPIEEAQKEAASILFSDISQKCVLLFPRN